MFWMLRVVDPVAALEGRGYPPGMEARLHLRLSDESLPSTSGDFVLEVSGGRGKVSPGCEGRFRTSERGLAAIDSGHLSPLSALVAVRVGEEGQAVGRGGRVRCKKESTILPRVDSSSQWSEVSPREGNHWKNEPAAKRISRSTAKRKPGIA